MTTGSRPRRPSVPQAAESLPSAPQTTPTNVGYGHGDRSFTLQAIMDMQKSIGELISTVGTLKSSVDSVKSKVDGLDAWKNRILGGAMVLSVVTTVFGFGIAKFSEYITIKSPEKIPAQVVNSESQQTTVVQPPKPLKK